MPGADWPIPPGAVCDESALGGLASVLMKGLIEIQIGGFRYGIWEEALSDQRAVRRVHGIPRLPERVSGVADIDGEPTPLFDLAFCLGHAPFDRRRSGTALMLRGEEGLEGFVFEGESARVEVDEDDVVPLPEWVQLPELCSCVLRSEQLVPVVEIGALHRGLRNGEWEPPVLASSRALPSEAEASSSKRFRVVMLDGERYAISADQLDGESVPARSVQPLHPAARHVAGILWRDGKIRLVLSLARLMGREGAGELGVVLRSKVGDLALLVDEELGAWGEDLDPKPMPAIAASNLIKQALLDRGEVIPVLEQQAAGSAQGVVLPGGVYQPDSSFAASFMREEVEVIECGFSGIRCGIPASEFRDTVALGEIRSIAGLPSIVLGVAEHHGEVLPVLDLGVCFGRRTRSAAGSKAMVLKNGDFRALVLADDDGRRCLLTPELQRRLPISRSRRYVYGCYFDEGWVRLILNVEALARDFDETAIQDYFGNLSEVTSKPPEQGEPAQPSGVEADAGTLAGVESEGVSGTHRAEGREEEGREEQEAHEAREDESGTARAAEAGTEAGKKTGTEEGAEAGQDGASDSQPVAEKAAEEMAEEDWENVSEPVTEGDWPSEPAPAALEALEALEAWESDAEPVTEEDWEGARTAATRKARAGRRSASLLGVILALSAAALFFAVELGETAPGEGEGGEGERRGSEEVVQTALTAESELEQAGRALDELAPGAAAPAALEVQRPESVENQGQQPEVVDKAAPTIQPLILLEIEAETQEISIRRVNSAPTGAEVYVIKKGDTLWAIAEQFTGNPFNYPRIASDSAIRDPDFILPGQRILIVVKGGG